MGMKYPYKTTDPEIYAQFLIGSSYEIQCYGGVSSCWLDLKEWRSFMTDYCPQEEKRRGGMLCLSPTRECCADSAALISEGS